MGTPSRMSLTEQEELEIALALSQDITSGSDLPSEEFEGDCRVSDTPPCSFEQFPEEPTKKARIPPIKEFPDEAVAVLAQLEQNPSASHNISSFLPTIDGLVDKRAAAEKRRLRRRLKQLGLVELEMPSDGNCQFSSIADQLLGTWREGWTVRHHAVQQIITYRELYSRFLPYNFEVYCTAMSQNQWGDNVTLQAAADYFGVQIYLITSLKDNILIKITPREFKSSKTLWLSYIGGTHFNSLYTQEEWEARRRATPKTECTLM